MPRIRTTLDQSPAFWFVAGSSAAVIYRKVPRPLLLSFALGAGAAFLCLERTGSAALTLARVKEKRNVATDLETNVVEEETEEQAWFTLPSLPTLTLPAWSSSTRTDVEQLKQEIAELRSLLTPPRDGAPASASALPREDTSMNDTVVL